MNSNENHTKSNGVMYVIIPDVPSLFLTRLIVKHHEARDVENSEFIE